MPERLARAINNLLDNAAHHSAAGGVVEVVVDDTACACATTAPGSTRRDLPYVFDRFFRGANSRHRQGSGLGLAIVRQVADAARRLGRGGQRARRRRGVHAAIPVDRPTTAPMARTSPFPSAGDPLPLGWPAAAGRFAGFAIRACRAIRNRFRRNHAQTANTAATGTSSSEPDRRRPDGQRDRELDATAGIAGQQHRMGAITREVLARGHLGHPEQTDDDAADQRRPAMVDHSDDQRHDAGEDRELGHREPAERTLRALPVGTHRTGAPPCGPRLIDSPLDAAAARVARRLAHHPRDHRLATGEAAALPRNPYAAAVGGAADARRVASLTRAPPGP